MLQEVRRPMLLVRRLELISEDIEVEESIGLQHNDDEPKGFTHLSEDVAETMWRNKSYFIIIVQKPKANLRRRDEVSEVHINVRLEERNCRDAFQLKSDISG